MKPLWSAAILGLSLLMPQPTHAAEIKAFFTGAARRSLESILPKFEAASGHKVAATYELPPLLVKRVEAGEPFDVLVLSYDVADLIKLGKLAADSRTVLGGIGVGVAVRQGTPRPDFSTVEKFKRMLIDAKSFATSGQGSSGRYVDGLLDRLGIPEVKAKIKSGGAGSSAQMLANGEVDLVVSGLPPLVGTPGLDWLGEIPAEINSVVLFTGALNVKAEQPEAGRALLKYLTTPEAVAIWKENGLGPAP